MRVFFKKLRETFVDINFIKFCLLGIINTLNAAVISYFTHLIIQPNISALLAYAVSLSIGFVLNCYITFKRRPTIRGYFRFLISYIPHFTFYFLTTFVTINILDIPQFWATILSAVAGSPITFILIKLYAFGKK